MNNNTARVRYENFLAPRKCEYTKLIERWVLPPGPDEGEAVRYPGLRVATAKLHTPFQASRGW